MDARCRTGMQAPVKNEYRLGPEVFHGSRQGTAENKAVGEAGDDATVGFVFLSIESRANGLVTPMSLLRELAACPWAEWARQLRETRSVICPDGESRNE